MIPMFLILQIIDQLKFFEFISPPTVDIAAKELHSTITFQKTSPNYLLGLYEPGLSLKTLFMSPVNRFKESNVSLFPDFLTICVAGLLVVIVVVFLSYVATLVSKRITREMMTDLLRKQKKKFIWNGFITPFFINFTFQCSKAMQLMLKGQFRSPIQVYVALLAILVILAYFLKKYRKELGEKEMVEKY